MDKPEDKFKAMMGEKLYDVEHALGMYALSFYQFPAQNIYDNDLVEKLGSGVRDCHIYLIGLVPTLDLKGARQEEQAVIFEYQ